MSDNSNPAPTGRDVQPLRYGIFATDGSGLGAGAGAGINRRTFLQMRRQQATPGSPAAGVVVIDMSSPALDADWLRLLAEQSVGDPARCTLTLTQEGTAYALARGAVTWTPLEPSPDVQLAMIAMQRRDLATLLRLTAGA